VSNAAPLHRYSPLLRRRSYCILSCPDFNSPFYCDAAHPQDVFPESDGRSTYNHLIDAVLKNAAGRAAYLAKLRWIMDSYLSTGWLQGQVGGMHDAIAASARADNAKWCDCDAMSRQAMPGLF
jgi:hypothetical protein